MFEICWSLVAGLDGGVGGGARISSFRDGLKLDSSGTFLAALRDRWVT